MKNRYTVTSLFTSLLVFGIWLAANAQANPIEKDKNRLDFNENRPWYETKNEVIGEAIPAGQSIAQNPRPGRQEQRSGGRRGFGGGRGPRQQEPLVDRFDLDKDGKLNDDERKVARQYIQERRGQAGPPRPSGQATPNTPLTDDMKASVVTTPDGKPEFYDTDTVRTLYLRFHDDDWYEQLGDFYRTDVDVPADLIADGRIYPSVGVHFRGSSSYFTIQDDEKKSLNIAVDYGDDGQRLYGYKTLNLLNGHSDPSFLREVLYSRIAREYLPAPEANFVKLFINGEAWGIYINSQQFNKDFLQGWFGTKKGVRWKVPPGNESGLVYKGEDPANYQQSYQLKTNEKEAPDAWRDLVALCKTLYSTPDEQLETKLSAIFNIDRALWFLALENVFIDNDGYISRASDYAIYQDTSGRFHLLPHDSNETFRYVGRGGPNSWNTGDSMLSPVAQEHDEMRPVIRRLLAIPHLRARYFAHIRTIINEWLDWEILGPVVDEYQSLIDVAVKADDKKLYSYEAFAANYVQDRRDGNNFDMDRSSRGAPNFRDFVTVRREFLLNHPEINQPTPVITSVSQPENPMVNQPVRIEVTVDADVNADSVILY